MSDCLNMIIFVYDIAIVLGKVGVKLLIECLLLSLCKEKQVQAIEHNVTMLEY